MKTVKKIYDEVATRATVREFLQFPAGALPAADFVRDYESDLVCNLWSYLRRFVQGKSAVRFMIQIRLKADRDGWRQGKVVRV